jgi:hypothetical protein
MTIRKPEIAEPLPAAIAVTRMPFDLSVRPWAPL